MKTQFLLSSALLTSLLLAPPFASADSAADPSAKSKPTASPAKPALNKGTVNTAQSNPNSSTNSGTLRTSKTALGVRIDYAFDAVATGRTTDVRLKIEGIEAGRPLSIEVVPGSGLQMARGLPGSLVQSAPSAEHVMAITPTSDGLHYIHIFLRSGDMSEALAIAVPTGKTQSLAKPVAPKTMPDGRRVMSIPAQQ
jgi:hypothetical protein